MSQQYSRYVSCDWLNSGIEFRHDSVGLCCFAHLQGKEAEIKTTIIPKYKGEIINWQTFFQLKNKYKTQLSQGNMIPECKGCAYLYEDVWDSGNYISNINFKNQINCNAKCIYCSLERFKKEVPDFKDYKILPIIKDMISKNIIKTNGTVIFEGGEPTVSPEFEELVYILMQGGIKNIKIFTNAIKYSKIIEQALSKGVGQIIISTDSGTRNTYETIKRVPAYDVVWQNIRKYTKIQSKPDLVKIKYIIIPGLNNQKIEIDAWIRKSKECGVNAVVVDIEHSWYAKYGDNMPQAMYSILDYIVGQAQKYGMSVEADFE